MKIGLFLAQGIFLTVMSLATQSVSAQAASDDLMSITKIRVDVKSRHASSYDRSGGNNDRITDIADGQSRTLLNVKGAGVITRIWITLSPKANELSRNDVILRMYWDGNPEPSVVAPIGPFFGQGWNESYPFVSAPLAAAPGGGGLAMTSYFPMPFARGARIEVTNDTGRSITALYFNIDYEEMKSLPAQTGRFHAWFNREITTASPEGIMGPPGKNLTGEHNYLIADIKGHGQFVGVNYYVQSPTPVWYGEGDEMVFIDGDKLPSINGTGTEDYFNMAWCPRDLYSHPYFGLAYTSNQIGFLGRAHNYRFHLADPIYFDKSLRFTIEHGHANNLTLDLATVAYWYQSEAVGVPAIPNREGRKLKPLISEMDIYNWHEAWRTQRNLGGNAWGDEWH